MPRGEGEATVEAVADLLAAFQNDPRLARVLEASAPDRTESGSTTHREVLAGVTDDIAGELHVLESDSVESFVEHAGTLVSLRKEIVKCDTALEQMEKTLLAFQFGLGGISKKIRELQSASTEMNCKVRNRSNVLEVLSTYVRQVAATPSLVHKICDDPVDTSDYLHQIDTLTRKLEHASQLGTQNNPSNASSIAELQKLEMKAIERIRDFFIAKIESLKVPRTNVQMIQQNVLVAHKELFHFLVNRHPRTAFATRQLYVTLVGKVYLAQFRTYTASLEKVAAENSATKNDLLGLPVTSTAAPTAMFGNLLRLGAPADSGPMPSRNVFSLAGRDRLLRELDRDPVVPHSVLAAAARPGAPPAPKFPPEEIFRSHQKLLMDTATTEYHFLCDFFEASAPRDRRGPARRAAGGRPSALFVDVCQRTLQFFETLAENIAAGTHDALGLLLMIRVNEYNRLVMQRRQVPCLDAYIDRVEATFWPRALAILNANLASLRRATPETLLADIPAAQRTKPHYVSRRFAEYLSGLCALIIPLGGGEPEERLSNIVSALQAAMENLLRVMSSEFMNPKDRMVFFIDNVDLMGQVLNENRLGASEIGSRLDDLLRDEITAFVDAQLHDNFADLLRFVATAEAALEDAKSSPTEVGAFAAVPPGINIAKMEQLVRHFGSTWKVTLESLHGSISASFTNFNNGNEILKQTLTQVLLYHTRFQKIAARCFPHQPQPAWVKEIVPNSAILTEIRKYSR